MQQVKIAESECLKEIGTQFEMIAHEPRRVLACVANALYMTAYYMTQRSDQADFCELASQVMQLGSRFEDTMGLSGPLLLQAVGDLDESLAPARTFRIQISGGKEGEEEASLVLSEYEFSCRDHGKLVSEMMASGRRAVDAGLTNAYWVRVDTSHAMPMRIGHDGSATYLDEHGTMLGRDRMVEERLQQRY